MMNGIEKRTYLAWHGDGLVDLGLGSVIFLFGLGMQVDQVLFAPIFASVCYPLWLVAKKRITEKRFGYVEFSDERKQKEKQGKVILLLLGSFTFLMGVMAYHVAIGGGTGANFMHQNGYLMLGMVFGLLSSSIGLVIGLSRLHVYTSLILVSVALVHTMAWPHPYGIMIPGLVILIAGISLLGQFLWKYPAGDPEMIEGEE
jgi:MFS family permease